jgi:tRNA(Ile2) C34 agmatinyltransferase TiaS
MPPVYLPFCNKCGTRRGVVILPTGQEDIHCPKCRKLDDEIKSIRRELRK